eukprot:s863_g4.t1
MAVSLKRPSDGGEGCSILSELPATAASASSRLLLASSGSQWALPDLSASSRSQWALPDLNREPEIPVGTAGPQPRAPYRSGHCRTSTASPRSQWALPAFNREPQIPVGTAGPQPQIPVGTAGPQPPDRMSEGMTSVALALGHGQAATLSGEIQLTIKTAELKDGGVTTAGLTLVGLISVLRTGGPLYLANAPVPVGDEHPCWMDLSTVLSNALDREYAKYGNSTGQMKAVVPIVLNANLWAEMKYSWINENKDRQVQRAASAREIQQGAFIQSIGCRSLETNRRHPDYPCRGGGHPTNCDV